MWESPPFPGGLRAPAPRAWKLPGFARERTPFRGALVFSVPPRGAWPRGGNFIVFPPVSVDELRMRLGYTGENGTVAGSGLALPSPLCCYRIGGGASCVSMQYSFPFGGGGLGMI